MAGKRDEAVRRMRQAHDLLGDLSVSWSLAELLRGYGAFSSAIPLYESVIARKGAAVRWDQQAWWVCSFAHAARCYRAGGRDADAGKAYNQFLAHWGGQAHLRLVQEALAEQARLSRG